MGIPIFLKVAYFLTVSIVFLFISKTLRLNNLKTRTAMNAKTSVFVICVKVIMYLLKYNLHDCTFIQRWVGMGGWAVFEIFEK